jgi:hypothetical protein
MVELLLLVAAVLVGTEDASPTAPRVHGCRGGWAGHLSARLSLDADLCIIMYVFGGVWG